MGIFFCHSSDCESRLLRLTLTFLVKAPLCSMFDTRYRYGRSLLSVLCIHCVCISAPFSESLLIRTNGAAPPVVMGWQCSRIAQAKHDLKITRQEADVLKMVELFEKRLCETKMRIQEIQELNVSWEEVKKKWRSVRDQLDSEQRPLVVILLNIHANLKDSWKCMGSNG